MDTRPDWFVLIEQWVPRQMGQTGTTLPFLAGALALKRGTASVSEANLRSLLDEIITSPVPGFATEIRWCHNIDAPVLTVASIDKLLPFRSCMSSPNGQLSLGFSQDVQSSFGGLDGTSASSCLERLVAYAMPHVAAGKFSRVRNTDASGFEYGAFLPNEVAYIRGTIRA